jgi:hypothetical protein
VRKAIVVGALAVGAFVAAIVYLNPGSAAKPPAMAQSAGQRLAPAPGDGGPQSSASGGTISAEAGRTAPTQVPSDPRLAALAVSPDNGLIEFVRAPDGKVIAELDKDPSSPSFKKPLREYLYRGDRVVGLTAFRYLPDHTEIDRTSVSYKPDGSVDRFEQATSIDAVKKTK